MRSLPIAQQHHLCRLGLHDDWSFIIIRILYILFFFFFFFFFFSWRLMQIEFQVLNGRGYSTAACSEKCISFRLSWSRRGGRNTWILIPKRQLVLLADDQFLRQLWKGLFVLPWSSFVLQHCYRLSMSTRTIALIFQCSEEFLQTQVLNIDAMVLWTSHGQY